MSEDRGFSEITILTPCYNSEKYIIRTVNSVLKQKAVIEGRVNLKYYVLDGGSTDNTLGLLKEIQSDQLKVISEKDGGMYDALSKGLKKINNGWCAYLNAGDYYHPLAFDILFDIIKSHQSIKWITGYSVYYSDQGYPVSFKLPYIYRRNLINKGAYDGKLPFIQQESTFWEASLNNLLDYDFLANLKMAGDYYLWYSFSKNVPLHIVEAYLGGFCIHPGQASENINDYRKEILKFCSLIYPWDWVTVLIDNLIWFMPARMKRRLNKRLHKYNHLKAGWD
jgi:glycosyltransferase involved in cell wall biosynthesis